MAYKRGRYYYRSKREGQHVRTEYLGTGVLALAIAELDAEERERQRQEQAIVRAEQEAQRAIDRKIDEEGDLVRTLTRAVLLVSGYHNHKGQWRRRRDGG